MNQRFIRPATRVASGVSLLAVAFSALISCGGQSIRYVDDGEGGEPNEPRGGAPNGGKGGSGARPAGGTSSGGSIAIGGTGAVGTGGRGGTIAVGGTGGSIAIGGTGAVGTGGVGGDCVTSDPITPALSLPFGPDGIIYPGSNPYGISGSWYSFDDCPSASPAGLTCTWREPALLGPDGLTGWIIQTEHSCASGTAPRVEIGPDGAPAYDLQWGFGLGVSLNQGKPWDAASRCIRGFVIELTGAAPARLRVNVVTPKTNGTSHFVEVPLGGDVVVDFASIRQGPWVASPTPLDTTQISDLQFHVFTNEQAPVPYHFCVSDIRPMQ